MSEQIFTDQPVTQLPEDAPPERFGRWVLHRAGIVNVWQYDNAELLFAGGRALLRGRNGAGKSKALEVLLPFLLDGDTRAIDAAARDRTTVYWLMTDGRDPGNHVGYVWLELRLSAGDGDDRFVTIGAGLKAATSSHSSSSWFFITDEHRVGADLTLGPGVSIDGLRELIGSEAVTPSAPEHRRRVGARLFGLSDEARYGNLLRLLRTLRDPNIGNKIEAGELARVLSEALPPPSDSALEMAAERFDDLDQIREQLARVQRTSRALDQFLDTYRGYAATVLRRRAGAAAEAEQQRASRERESRRATSRADDAGKVLEQAKAEVLRLGGEQEQAQRELEALRQSDAYKHHLSLVDRQGKVAALDEAAGKAEGHADTLAGLTREAESRAAEATAEAERRIGGVRAGRPALLALAAAAGIDRAVIPEDAPERIPNAIGVAAGRRRGAEQVLELAKLAAEARQKANQADDQAARSEGELAARAEETDTARRLWVTASQSWRERVRSWARSDLAPPDGLGLAVDDLERALSDGGAEAEELDAARAAAGAAIRPLRDAARAAEATAHTAVLAARQTLSEHEAERDAVAAQEEARPPRSRFQVAERDPEAGAALYELVEVDASLSPAQRAGLEAGLEASGLLDVWVSADGVLLHPSTQDVILGPGAPRLPDGVPSLASVLSSASQEVVAVLSCVGWGAPPRTAGGAAAAFPWVAADGRWSLGPLSGLWAKDRSEYLGAGARRETRRRRLEELERQVDESRTSLAAAERVLGRRRDGAAAIEEHATGFPDGRDVSSARSEHQSRRRVQSEAATRHDQDRRVAEQERTQAAQIQAKVAHAAGRDSLPVEAEPLGAVIDAARTLEHDLQAWRAQWEQAATGRRAADRAQHDAEGLRITAAAAVTEAHSARKQHYEEAEALRTLQEAVGGSAAEVLAAIDSWSQRERTARNALPTAHDHTRAAASEHGQALEAARTARDAVLGAEAELAQAGKRLRRALELPGVLAAALDGQDPVVDPGLADAALARQVAGAIPAGEAVSDQTVLNRIHELEDGLVGGYDVISGEEDSIKFFHVADDTGRQPLVSVAARVSAEAAAAADRLVASEREVIERFLLGELGEELRDRLLEAHDLVASANSALATQRTSHGIGAHLDWRIDDAASVVARSAAEILVKSPRGADEDATLRDALMEMIRAEREREPDVGYLQHLRIALDYRNWHRFTVKVVDDARPGTMRNLHARLGLSQGEQRVISYLALFAAASAYYDGIGGDCPRLLLLDDAFAKVDEPTHGRLLSLLVELNLDFVITSERMWGCFPQLPSLEIYEALRDPGTPGVALVHFHWDGNTRHLVGV